MCNVTLRPLLIATLLVVSVALHAQDVLPGADLLMTSQFELIKGKRVGLIVNHTALLSDGSHLADVIHNHPEVTLAALYGPEHGVRGDTTGPVADAVDPNTGVTVHSLYGKTYKPTPEMLRGVDVLVFDIQDVGARFYTYISTLGHAMSAAAEQNIPFIVLDRPNPIGGVYVDGPVRHDTMKSFVAYGKIPIAHGMTIGELAAMYNGEGWLDNGVKADLKIVKMENWKRSLWFDQTGMRWVRPSPNMPTLATATVYPGTCLFEGVNISEGRGTDFPFETIGAPWISPEQALTLLENAPLRGVRFEPVRFTPTMRPNNARPPKYDGELCHGVLVRVTDRSVFEPVRAGIWLLWAFKKVHPDRMQWRLPGFDRLSGTADIRLMLDAGRTPEEIFSRWDEDLAKFKVIRERYLLYR